MNPFYQAMGQGVWIITVVLILVVQGLNQFGICFNTTQSMPMGVYYRSPLTPKTTLQRGMLVSFCPPSSKVFQFAITRHYLTSGTCPLSQTQPLLKPVAAVSGDQITIGPAGISVNGRLLAASQARSQDSQGRVVQKMLQGTYTVKAGEVLLISSHSPRSFDSRYFGPVPLTQIQWIVHPLLTGD